MEELEKKVGQEFKKSRHGITNIVVLEDVRRDKVMLREKDHADGFTLPIAKFQKFYRENV
tara:strand:- start:1171 stop:1350 length:180 start_codon:yes stop_codon:yes gene_type:complete